MFCIDRRGTALVTIHIQLLSMDAVGLFGTMPSRCRTICRRGKEGQSLAASWIWMRMKWFSVSTALKVLFSSKSLAVQSKCPNTHSSQHPQIGWIIHIEVSNKLVCFCRDGFFAAASCMSFQQCRFNFGSEPFKFPPKTRSFESFNSHAYLKDQDKIVLPRHLFLEQLRKLSVREDSCTLCFDLKGIVRLEPCTHR